jgi:rhodanese-related sulfurtransferase
MTGMRMQQVDVETLQEWLTVGRPVTVLDIRTPEDSAQWFIPGSIHVNAYDALKAEDPQALKGVDLPNDRPVVTICNAGKVSQIAAEHLHERGLEASSLTGGMKSWSLAWNTAETELQNATVLQVRRTGKGCLSYVVGSASEAVVIDASVEPDVLSVDKSLSHHEINDLRPPSTCPIIPALCHVTTVSSWPNSPSLSW